MNIRGRQGISDAQKKHTNNEAFQRQSVMEIKPPGYNINTMYLLYEWR